MSITIGNLSFDGPFTDTSQLQARSGVYAILGCGSAGGNWIVVDVGESGDVKTRIDGHDRKLQWHGAGHATLAVAANYCDAPTRMLVERQLRQQYNPACGDR
jgi:hypothetical protein